jgi:hypothetical protein
MPLVYLDMLALQRMNILLKFFWHISREIDKIDPLYSKALNGYKAGSMGHTLTENEFNVKMEYHLNPTREYCNIYRQAVREKGGKACIGFWIDPKDENDRKEFLKITQDIIKNFDENGMEIGDRN